MIEAIPIKFTLRNDLIFWIGHSLSSDWSAFIIIISTIARESFKCTTNLQLSFTIDFGLFLCVHSNIVSMVATISIK